MRTIRETDDPILRMRAESVAEATISSPFMTTLLHDMSTLLDTRDDGVALAAPQVGESLRLFIVSRKIFETEHAPAPDEDLVFINPTLVRHGAEEIVSDEGCLSVPNLYGAVPRYHTATIQALDRNGTAFTMDGTGLLAQIFQHELDHLDGVLYTDKATSIETFNAE